MFKFVSLFLSGLILVRIADSVYEGAQTIRYLFDSLYYVSGDTVSVGNGCKPVEIVDGPDIVPMDMQFVFRDSGIYFGVLPTSRR